METIYNGLPFYHILLYVALGLVLLVVFYIVESYIIPLLNDQQHVVKKYWKKIEISFWLVFAGLFFIASFRINMMITLIFSGVILGLGWNFWRNLFSGIVIRLNEEFRIGERIATDYTTGEIKSINFTQTQLVNDQGELVVIPNFTLRSGVLKHLYKKNNTRSHSFRFKSSTITSLDDIKYLAINCPYISSNQRIEVRRNDDDEIYVNASLIDIAYIEKVKVYFSEF